MCVILIISIIIIVSSLDNVFISVAWDLESECRLANQRSLLQQQGTENVLRIEQVLQETDRNRKQTVCTFGGKRDIF